MYDNYQVVKDAPGLLRDPVSKAIINTNVKDLLDHRKKKALHRQSLLAIQTHELRINNIEESINDIKRMLQLLLAEK